MTTLVGVSVATQGIASAGGFGPNAFINIDGNVRYVQDTSPPGPNQFGWANSGATTPVNSCPVGAVNVSGSNGLYNCGAPNPANSGSTTFVPVPPAYTGPAVLAQSFQTAPSQSDTVQCNATTTAVGSYQFGGGDKFDSGLSQLSYSVGQTPPPKDVVTDAYIVTRVNSLNEVEAYFGAQRTNNNGDSHVDFQFLQDNVSMTQSTAGNSCAGGFAGSREQGDILVELNYIGGGGVPSPNVYVWTCNTSSPTGTKCDTSGSWVSHTFPTGSVVENVNTAPIPCGGWVCEGSLGPSQIDTNEFVEGAINFGTAGLPATCGSSVFVETRSSQSSSAQVKALTKPASFANCAPTHTTTTPSAPSIQLGNTITDGVTVSGGVGSAPTGTVTFYVCSKTTTGCDPANGTALTGTVSSPNPATLVNGSANSPAFSPPAAGKYCFAGVFTPAAGTFNEGSSDTSSGECFSVSPLPPAFTTSITSPQSSAVGNSWNDTATLTGTSPYGAPTGSVSFSVCKEATVGTPCTTGGTSVGSVNTPVVNGTIATYALPSVDAFTPGSVGGYCYLAAYTATTDGNYSSVGQETNTECFTVTAAGSTTATVATGHAAAGSFGTVTDEVSVTGNLAGGMPTGSVTFYFCQASTSTDTPGPCPTTGTNTATVGLTQGSASDIGVASSGSFSPSGTGTWCFGAVYTPDSSSNYTGSADNTTAANASSLECVNIASLTPSVATTVVNESAPSNVTGAVYHDTATITGVPGTTPTGTLTYTLYATSDCTGTPVNSWTVNLVGGAVPNSPSVGAPGLGAGSYCYLATYNGDTNYNSASAANEPFTVSKAPMSIDTTVFDAATSSAWDLTNGELAPASAYDTYSYNQNDLISGFTPTGTVTYTLYTGNCNGTVLKTSTVSVGNASPTVTGLAAGSYGYLASYSGDSNYLPSGVGTCEPFQVVTPILTAVKSADPTPVGPSSAGLVTIGQTITYTITLTNTGTAPASNVTVTDSIPAGTTPVLGSASSTPTNGSGSVTASGLSWTFSSPIGINSSQSVSFEVTVNSADTNGQTIDNFAVFTNEGTPNCSAATCDTNTVEHVVATPIIDAAKAEPTPGDGVSVTAGQSAPITYTIAVTNAGLLAATNVVVKDVIPAGSTYVPSSATPASDATFNGTTLTWTIPTVPAAANTVPGEVDVSFQVTVNSADTDGSTITNQATFSNVNTGDCVVAPATGFCLTNTVSNPVVAPIVDAVKSSTPPDGSTVPAGSQVVYTISLTNAGHADATETVTDVVPAGTTFVSASGGVTPDNTGLITWSGVSVPAGTTSASPVQVSFTVTVNLADADLTVIPNHAIYNNVNSPNCLTTNGDTTAGTCDTNTVNLTVTKPIIDVVKSEPTPGNGKQVQAGMQQTPSNSTITYNLLVTNSGSQDATDILVTDPIPAGATYVSGSANDNGNYDSTTNSVIWTVSVPGAVDGEAGTFGPLSFQVTVNPSDANGSNINNQASFTDDNTPGCTQGPSQGSCLTNEVSNPVIEPIINVVKSETTPGNGQTVTAGQSAPITYSLVASNTGSADATNVTISDVVPAGATYVPNSANAGGQYDSTTNTITWTLPSLAAGANSSALTFEVTVNSSDANGSTITNQADFTDVNTPNCDSGTGAAAAAVGAQNCLTDQVSNPVQVITPVSSTAPQIATTTTVPKPALAFTGANVRALALFAFALLGTGLGLVLLGRRRRRAAN